MYSHESRPVNDGRAHIGERDGHNCKILAWAYYRSPAESSSVALPDTASIDHVRGSATRAESTQAQRRLHARATRIRWWLTGSCTRRVRSSRLRQRRGFGSYPASKHHRHTKRNLHHYTDAYSVQHERQTAATVAHSVDPDGKLTKVANRLYLVSSGWLFPLDSRQLLLSGN
jgi:hypothetical protein